ncbi:ww domain binding protein [Anaeramoeba flamelloides]|uniref:Ww domain binding protein n=1 Tax=Anaeramoeba flamelloides TaxID=1746091 RepID=A0ABQ8Z6E8_9EUKA|nr:ww domain binding protein [Anaeramoeba flamelloides]
MTEEILTQETEHGKYYCKYCNAYIANNKPSINRHLNGNRHKINYQNYVRKAQSSQLSNQSNEGDQVLKNSIARVRKQLERQVQRQKRIQEQRKNKYKKKKNQQNEKENDNENENENEKEKEKENEKGKGKGKGNYSNKNQNSSKIQVVHTTINKNIVELGDKTYDLTDPDQLRDYNFQILKAQEFLKQQQQQEQQQQQRKAKTTSTLAFGQWESVKREKPDSDEETNQGWGNLTLQGTTQEESQQNTKNLSNQQNTEKPQPSAYIPVHLKRYTNKIKSIKSKKGKVSFGFKKRRLLKPKKKLN